MNINQQILAVSNSLLTVFNDGNIAPDDKLDIGIFIMKLSEEFCDSLLNEDTPTQYRDMVIAVIQEEKNK